MNANIQVAHVADDPAGTVRSFELIDGLIPYDQKYIQFRCRIPDTLPLSRSHPLAILTFAAADAPVCYRIHEVEGGQPPIEIRHYDGRFWWPLLDGGSPVDRQSFISSAASCGSGARSVLFNAWQWPGHVGHPPEWFFQEFPKCRLVDSTFERQAGFATRGADRIAFCDGLAVIAAGPPVYYGGTFDRRHARSVRNGGIQAGTPSLVLTRDNGYRLAGPHRYDRCVSASQGLVRDAEEIEILTDAMKLRGLPSILRSRIEVVHPFEADPAPVTCMQGLVEKLWTGADPGNGWDWPWLRRYVPSLAGADKNADIEFLPYRTVLDEFIAFDASTDIRQLREDAEIARTIATRLDRQDKRLSTDEDDALWSVADSGSNSVEAAGIHNTGP